MPSSYHGFLTDVIDFYCKIGPASVLDVGVGFGKWGLLFREYGDIIKDRVFKKDWKRKIVGVEIYSKYITEVHQYIYDQILIGDIAKISETIDDFDFIFCGDVIEHLKKDIAYKTINNLIRKSKYLCIVIPLGGEWGQGESNGNINESHLSVWEEKDFANCVLSNKIIKRHPNPKRGNIGMFVIKGLIN